MSSFPLSIGTALAMETFFSGRTSPYDAEREIPTKVEVSNYSTIYINLSTLLRNMLGSITPEEAVSVTAESVIDTLYSEIEVIESLFATEGNATCKPIFYFNNFKSVVDAFKYKKVLFRKPNNATEILFEKLLVEAEKSMTKTNDTIVMFTEFVKPDKAIKSLILTHHAFELLSKRKFRQLDLIESHTGKLKQYNTWYTKLAPVGSMDYSKLPFNGITLCVFGDKYLIQPTPIRMRRLVDEIATKNHWSPITTVEKVFFDLEREVREPMVLEYINSYPRF
jgi:hypothetical protein